MNTKKKPYTYKYRQLPQTAQYGKGGFWSKVGGYYYGTLEGTLDTVTGGLTDGLTDKGYEALSKLDGTDNDEEINKFRGVGTVAGSVIGGVVSGNVAGASQQGLKGVSQFTDGKVSNTFSDLSQVAGMASMFTGGGKSPVGQSPVGKETMAQNLLGGNEIPYLAAYGGPIYRKLGPLRPMANGGDFWSKAGGVAYGVLEGTLDTMTGGLTDGITDRGYEALSKLDGTDNDKEINKFRGVGIMAGAGPSAQGLKGASMTFTNNKVSNTLSDLSEIAGMAQGISQGISEGFTGNIKGKSPVGKEIMAENLIDGNGIPYLAAYGGPVYRKLGPLNPLAFGGPTDPPPTKKHPLDPNPDGSLPSYFKGSEENPVQLDEFTVTAEAPEWLKYSREYINNNPFNIDEYIENRYNAPIGREAIKKIDGESWRKELRQESLEKRYNSAMNYAGEQLVKNKPQGKLSRAEWLNTMSDKEEELIKRNPKYQSSLWADTERGLTSLVEQNASQTFQNILNSSDYSIREKQEMLKDYADHPIMSRLGDAAKILSPLTVPSKMVQSAYKDGYSFTDALKGKKNNAGIVEDIITDPLNLVGLGIWSKLSKANKFVKLEDAYQAIKTLDKASLKSKVGTTLSDKEWQYLYRVQEKGFDIERPTLKAIEERVASGKGKWYDHNMLNNPELRANMESRDKYYGQWFESSPERLDYYLADKGEEVEILRTKIPKEVLEQYRIDKFDPEIAKKWSLSHETEYIVPKDLIQESEKFNKKDWQKLIDEHNAVKEAKLLGKTDGIVKPIASSVDDVAINLESQIAKLKQQEILAEESIKALWTDYKAGKITGEEYTKQVKSTQPWAPFENPIYPLQKQLRELSVKKDILNTPQKNILKNEQQLGKNISNGGTNNKGVFELNDKYVARLSAHGYDDASRLVNYADKLTSPRIMKTHQVKELSGKVYQVQDKATGIPYTQLSEQQLKNLPKNHIDNFYKDIAELEKNGLNIDISGGKSNIFYDSKKGFQFIDLGIGKMPDMNVIKEVVKLKYGGEIDEAIYGPTQKMAYGGEINPPKKKDLFSQYYAATGQDMAHLSKVNAYLDQLAEAESFSGLSQSSKNSSAKGFYHYLDDSVKTADQRIKNIQAKNKFDPELVKLLNEQLKLPIEKRSREMQSIMVLSDHMESPTAPYGDFIAGKVDGSELYYRGHHTEDPNAMSSKEKVKENWNNAGIRIKERNTKKANSNNAEIKIEEGSTKKVYDENSLIRPESNHTYLPDRIFSPLTKMAYGGEAKTNNMRFKYAAGGELQSIDTGGSHEQNPMGGVPMGPSASVEEGETVKDDFVFSDRIKVTKDIAREFSLPKSYVGKTYAAASKIGEKHNKHNDHIDAKTNELITARLTEAQEAWKAVHMPEQNPMMAQGMHQMPDGTMMPDSEMQGQQPPEMMGQGMPQQGGMPGMPEGMDPAMMEQIMAQGAPPQMMAYGGRIGMAYGGRMQYAQGGPTSGPTSNPENKYKGVPVPDYIYNRLLQEGYTDIAAKGILANIKHESNFVVSATEKKPNIYGTRGYGIVQWTDGKTAKRRTMMENWMEENGLDKADLDAQLDYLFYEIDNIPSNMPTGTNMSKEKLNQSTSVEDSTTYFMNNFEAPNAKTARLSQRIEYAKKIDPVVLSTEELQKLQKGFLDFENLPTEFFDENAQRINAPDSGLAPYNTAGPRGQDSLPIPGYPAPDFTLDEETGSVPVQTATADPRKLIQLPAQDNFAQKEDVQDVGLQPYGNNTAPRAQDPNYGWPKVNGPDQWGDLGNILKENGVSDEDIQRILNDPTSVTEVTKILDGEYSYSGTKDRAIKSQKITEFIKGARNTQSPSSSLPIPGYASPDFTAADPEKANEWRRGGMPATGRTYWDDNLHNEEEIIPGPYPVPQKNADDIMPDVNLVEEELENPSYDEVTNLLEKDRAIKEAKQAAEAAGAITENRYKGTGLEYAPVIANTIQGLSKPARLDKNDYTYQSSVTATPYNIEPQQRAARNAYATAQNAGRAASSDAGSYMSSLGNLYGAYTANNSRLYAEKENQEAQRLMAAQSAADQASQFNSQMGYRVDDWNQNSVDATRNHLMTAADQLGQIGARQSNYNMYNNLFQNQENVTQDVGQVNNVFDFLNGFGKNKEKKEGKALGGYFYKPKNS
jgi:hypothetical protein